MQCPEPPAAASDPELQMMLVGSSPTASSSVSPFENSHGTVAHSGSIAPATPRQSPSSCRAVAAARSTLSARQRPCRVQCACAAVNSAGKSTRAAPSIHSPAASVAATYGASSPRSHFSAPMLHFALVLKNAPHPHLAPDAHAHRHFDFTICRPSRRQRRVDSPTLNQPSARDRIDDPRGHPRRRRPAPSPPAATANGIPRARHSHASSVPATPWPTIRTSLTGRPAFIGRGATSAGSPPP